MWHHHTQEDELFWVIKGQLRMQLEDGEVIINEGEFVVIPHGTEHRPVADEECHLVLIEPAGTLNTGNTQGKLTVETPSEI